MSLVRSKAHGAPEEFRQRVQLEKQLATRLRLANTRLEDVQRESIWAIAAASEAGLSIRQIAVATDLSLSRVHQLLKAQEASEIPLWLSQLSTSLNLQDPEQVTDQHPPNPRFLLARLLKLRFCQECIAWLERLERGEDVVVNLRTKEDVKTEFVYFDC